LHHWFNFLLIPKSSNAAVWLANIGKDKN